MQQAIRHDAARRLAYQLVGIISPCLRQEEQSEALREFYEVIRPWLEDYEERIRGAKPERPGTTTEDGRPTPTREPIRVTAGSPPAEPTVGHVEKTAGGPGRTRG